MSDRIAVMNNGRVDQLGAPEEIYLRPATRFVASFIGQANLVPCTVASSGPDGMAVRLADGSVFRAGQGAAACRVERPGTLVLRPEHLKLRTAEPTATGESGIRVRLQERVFQGQVVRFQAATLDGMPLTITTSIDDAVPEVSSETPLWAVCNRERAYVLSEEEDA